MNIYHPGPSKIEDMAAANGISTPADNKPALQLTDNRPRSIVQKKQLEGLNKSGKSEGAVQRKLNNTGLPDQLKSGIENLSGHSMDDVKVHYNSAKPAQLNAHAYAQGTEIHLASGQEKHLPHEAWHVVQQKQGRVKPTLQMKGKVNINDDKGLEKEADVMGGRAQTYGITPIKIAPAVSAMGAIPLTGQRYSYIHALQATNNTVQRIGSADPIVELVCPAIYSSNMAGMPASLVFKSAKLASKFSGHLIDAFISRCVNEYSGHRGELLHFTIKELNRNMTIDELKAAIADRFASIHAPDVTQITATARFVGDNLSMTELLVSDGIRAHQPVRDQYQARVHDYNPGEREDHMVINATEEIVSNIAAKRGKVSLQDIKFANYCIQTDDYNPEGARNPGRYRDENIVVGDGQRRVVTYNRIDAEMVKLVAAVNRIIALPMPRTIQQVKLLIQMAAVVHSWLVEIHPFFNSNGKVARVLVNAILVTKGLPAAPIDHRNTGYKMAAALGWGGNYKFLSRVIAEAMMTGVGASI